MRSPVIFVLATILALLSLAYTAPVPLPVDAAQGRQPVGAARSRPSLDEIVPRGEQYTIKWTPNPPDHTATLLLRNPAENIRPLHAIAERVPNSGTNIWTPSADLEPDSTHYGIQLMDDKTGAYQYTSQFGVGRLRGDESLVKER
ncbi:MAG: hypothetical protein M1832_003600 [Thelocarpon impressellum]|nr:MAG: hypothetical protein M1832_003600 [Thelocarpon impressellum]